MTKFLKEFMKKRKGNRKRRSIPADHPYRTGYSLLPRLRVLNPSGDLKRAFTIPIKKRAEFKLEPTGRGRKAI